MKASNEAGPPFASALFHDSVALHRSTQAFTFGNLSSEIAASVPSAGYTIITK